LAIAEKSSVNDDVESFGTLPEFPDEPPELELLPQAAARRAAAATTDVRAIFLLALKSNETTSIVGAACRLKRGRYGCSPLWVARATAVR
jgi:hypothetical protein